MTRKLINVLLIILTVAFSSFGQDNFIEDGFKGIKLFKTHIKEVEKILGQPKKITKLGRYNYEADNFFFNVEYSSALCGEGRYGGGEYEIPLDTVVYYKIIPLKNIKLEDFKFKREKYEREPNSEYRNLFYYINSTGGILISSVLTDGVEYVNQIYVKPSPADEEKYKCRRYKSIVEKAQESKSAKEPDRVKP